MMIDSYTNSSVAIASSAQIPFQYNRYLVGCGTTHTPGSGTVSISKPGYYLINFNCGLACTAAQTLGVQLLNNGTAVNGVSATENAAGAGTANLAFNTVLNVNRSCACINNTANLSVINNQADATTCTNAEITVVRLNA